MYFLTEKSAAKLQATFSLYSLDELYQTKKCHDSNYKKIKTHLASLRHRSVTLKRLEHAEEEKLQTLKESEGDAILQEDARKRGIADTAEDRSADNYIARLYYLNYSPLATYLDSVCHAQTQLQHLKKESSKIDAKIATLHQKKRGCKSTLRIINSEIENKTVDTSEEHTALVQ